MVGRDCGVSLCAAAAIMKDKMTSQASLKNGKWKVKEKWKMKLLGYDNSEFVSFSPPPAGFYSTFTFVFSAASFCTSKSSCGSAY